MPPKPSAAASALVAGDANPAAAADAPSRTAGRTALKRSRVEVAHPLGVPEIDSQGLGILHEESTRLSGVPGDVPQWAAPFLLQMQRFDQSQQQVQQQIQQMQLAQQQMQGTLQQMKAGISNIEARMMNGLVGIADPLTPLAAQGGGVPANFPQTIGRIAALTAPELAALLQAYGQAVPHTLNHRRRAFVRYIGVRLN